MYIYGYIGMNRGLGLTSLGIKSPHDTDQRMFGSTVPLQKIKYGCG